MKKKKAATLVVRKDDKKEKEQVAAKTAVSSMRLPFEATAEFTKMLAQEIVRGLSFGRITSETFTKKEEVKQAIPELGEHPILVDTSILIDGRILPIVNSGFIVGTLLIPQFVLGEVQHIADSADSVRRAKGRRGLDVVNKLKWQRVNSLLKVKIIGDDVADKPEVDHKLVALAKQWGNIPSGKHIRLATVDFNLAHLARAQGVRVVSITDLAQALKLAIVPGEELSVKITHPGKEREQGVGYLPDGTMIVIDNAKDKVNLEVVVVVTKIHQTPAGQLFFARLK